MQFSAIARACSDVLGSAKAFAVAVAVVLLWALSGPLFAFSGTWQLVINTATTIMTFLAVFLLQHAQNVDTRAIHLKLDELILRNAQADNRFIHAERQDRPRIEELDKLHNST